MIWPRKVRFLASDFGNRRIEAVVRRRKYQTCLCVGCYYILDHSLSGLFILRKGGYIMRNYWYISLTNEYPRTIDDCSVRVVRSVQMKGKYSIVEMLREATPNEVDKCKLIYCGHGYWKDEYIQYNIERWIDR